MLLILILFCFIGSLIVLFFENTQVKIIRNFSLIWSLIALNFSIMLLGFYNFTSLNFQLLKIFEWLDDNFTIFAVDGLSLLLIVLTAFLTPICIILSWTLKLNANIRLYCFCFLLLESILIGIFSSFDLIIFYILFEAVLIPMFFIVGLFGSKTRRVRASYLLFLYTLISSILMFVSIILIFFVAGTTNYMILLNIELNPMIERFCWLCFFLSFAVKMPIAPFHIWLPEAHCEAPTAGSVILAGILLKLGGYGFLRFSITLFPEASAFFSPFVFLLCIIGLFYASLTTLQQIDLKKVIAYTSVGHMALVTMGIFSANFQGVIGSIYLMIAHGIVSSGLFLCIGVLYDRHNTRIIKYFAGLIHVMPIFSVIFIIFSLGNLGLPSTCNFVGEFLVILGTFKINSLASFAAGFGMILSAAYSLWLCNRIVFGNLKRSSVTIFQDLTRLEFFMFLPFVLLTFILGVFPEVILNYIKMFIYL